MAVTTPSFGATVGALLVVVMTLTGCAEPPVGSYIDPTKQLTRDDYKRLQDRPQDPVQAQTAVEPPIPAMQPAIAIPPELLSESGRRVTVTITEAVPLKDVLVELARQAQINLELDPRIEGGIIFSAHDQPLLTVLQRISALAGLRYALEDGFLRIELDEPYSLTYRVDYLNIDRTARSEIGIATNVFAAVGGSGEAGAGNNSTSLVTGEANASFWADVERDLKQLLDNTGRVRPLLARAGLQMAAAPLAATDPGAANGQFLAQAVGAGLGADATAPTVQATLADSPNFTVNRQAGIVSVFATQRQHRQVKAYLDELRHRAGTQVLIEARIIEVELLEAYRAGINWRTLFGGSVDFAANFPSTATTAVGPGGPFATAATAASRFFTGSVRTGDLAGVVNMVSQFGTVRTLSSPRLTVLNNQTAVLKVASNEVYFTSTVTAGSAATATSPAVAPTISSTPQTVPIGLVMLVQPAINRDSGEVNMTLRPTISRITSRVVDPSVAATIASIAATPGVAAAALTDVKSEIPVVEVREIDSMLSMQSGAIAILGGLMQDRSVNDETGIPIVSGLPWIGNLFKSRDHNSKVVELVVLLRATIVEQPSPPPSDIDLYKRYNRDPRPFYEGR